MAALRIESRTAVVAAAIETEVITFVVCLAPVLLRASAMLRVLRSSRSAVLPTKQKKGSQDMMLSRVVSYVIPSFCCAPSVKRQTKGWFPRFCHLWLWRVDTSLGDNHDFEMRRLSKHAGRDGRPTRTLVCRCQIQCHIQCVDIKSTFGWNLFCAVMLQHVANKAQNPMVVLGQCIENASDSSRMGKSVL